MAFETVLQAYNCFKGAPVKTLEARAQAINSDIQQNANADIQAYSIELEGIERALEEKRSEHTPVNVPEIAHTAADAEQREDAAASEEYRSAFYKHLQGRTLTEAERTAFNAANEKRSSEFNTLSNAAAVIPTTTLNEVISKARDMGGILSVARGFSMPSNIAIPVATPTGAAQWHTEGATVETQKAATVPVKFSAHEIMKILSISAATQSMSVSSFESYLVDELTASIMQTLAAGMVNGTGEDQATGILTGITWGASNTVTVAADAELTFTDILQAIGMLKRGYANGAKFVCNNRTLYQDVYSLKDQADRPIYVADLTNAGAGRIMGFDVIVDDFMPDHDILFGDFRYFGYNLPAGIALDVSRESSFKSGLIDYRALAIADAKPIVDEAFIKITKATE